MSEEIRGGIELLGKLGVILPVLGFILIGVVAFLIFGRTGSAYPLMTRLWRLFNESSKNKDSMICKFLDEQITLMELRFASGAKVRTNEHAHQLIDWARKHNENINDIAACGSYFDLERVTLKEESELPKPSHSFFRFAGAYALTMVAIVFAFGVVWNDALLRMKESGEFFVLSAEYAKPFGSKSGLSKTQCLSGETLPANDFSEGDAKIVCGIFEDESLVPYLKQTVIQQRFAFGFGALVLSGFAWVMFIWWRRGIKARDMFKRINKQKEQAALTLA